MSLLAVMTDILAKVFFVSSMEMWKFSTTRDYDDSFRSRMIMRYTLFLGWILHIVPECGVSSSYCVKVFPQPPLNNEIGSTLLFYKIPFLEQSGGIVFIL